MKSKDKCLLLHFIEIGIRLVVFLMFSILIWHNIMYIVCLLVGRTDMRKKFREFTLFILAMIVFYSFLFFLGVTCPIKALTGISCPGCGMTRAWISLLRLNPRRAFYYHPLFPLPAFVLMAYLYPNIVSYKSKKIGLGIIIGLFFIVYIWRMADPNNTIVVFRPDQSLLYQAYQILNK